MVHDGLPRKTVFCFVTKSPSESPSDPGHITRHIVCHIVYDIVYDVVYDVVCDVIYDILCCPPVLTVVWQDTLALVAPYPFRMEPLEDFDPLTDFDMTGGDDVWFARPQLFFSCTLCPTGQMENKSSHREVSLVFFSTFEPISLTPDSCMQKNGIPMLYERASSQLPTFMSARWKTFLAGSR